MTQGKCPLALIFNRTRRQQGQKHIIVAGVFERVAAHLAQSRNQARHGPENLAQHRSDVVIEQVVHGMSLIDSAEGGLDFRWGFHRQHCDHNGTPEVGVRIPG
jgi:hypothetical protein